MNKLTEYQKFAMSYWLQARVGEIGSRDLVDMYNDVCELKSILEQEMRKFEGWEVIEG